MKIFHLWNKKEIPRENYEIDLSDLMNANLRCRKRDTHKFTLKSKIHYRRFEKRKLQKSKESLKISSVANTFEFALYKDFFFWYNLWKLRDRRFFNGKIIKGPMDLEKPEAVQSLANKITPSIGLSTLPSMNWRWRALKEKIIFFIKFSSNYSTFQRSLMVSNCVNDFLLLPWPWLSFLSFCFRTFQKHSIGDESWLWDGQIKVLIWL